MALAHRELEPVRQLLTRGHPLTPPIAAALGALRTSPIEDARLTFALAVIKRPG